MCPYEVLAVTLVLTDVLDGGTIVYGPTNQLMFDVSSNNVTSPLSCNSTYNVSLVVENQASQTITINTMYSELDTAHVDTCILQYYSINGASYYHKSSCDHTH